MIKLNKKFSKFILPATILSAGVICFFMAYLFFMLTVSKIDTLKTTVEAKQDSTTVIIEKRIDKLQAGISRDTQRNWKITGLVKYMGNINKKLSYEKRYNYATFITNEAEKYDNLDVALIASVMRQESYFINESKSIKDAFGLMGIIEETGRWICKEQGNLYYDGILKVPEANIKMGCWFLSYLKAKYKNETLALAHYNGGGLQKNNYLNNKKYKNTKDFKHYTVEALEIKVELLEDSLKTDPKVAKKHKYYSKLLSGKTFKTETKKYIPEVLDRRIKIKHFLTEKAIVDYAVKADTSSTS